MIDQKRNQKIQRILLGIISALIVVVVVALYMSLRGNSTLQEDFAFNLIVFTGTAIGSSLLASVITAAVLRYLEKAHLDQVNDVVWLKDSEVKGILEDSIPSAEAWRYRGSSGQYVMDSVANRAIDSAIKQSREFKIELYLHDIRSTDQLRTYLEHRKNAQKQELSSDDLSVEFFSKVIASMARMGKIAARFGTSVNCAVYLQRNLGSVRIDMNNEFAVLTHPDNKGAIQIKKSNPFYSFIKQETEALAGSSHTLHLNKETLGNFAHDTKDDTEICKRIVAELNIEECHTSFSLDFWRQVIETSVKFTIEPDNPYRS